MTNPIRLDKTPLHVTVDVEPLVDSNVEELLDLLANEFFEDFMTAVCEESTGHDGHAPEALRFERLRQQLVERLATRVSLTGPEAVRVGERMADLGHSLASPSRGASEIRHPAMRATRQHLKAHPLPEQQDRRAS
ncbi:hypothetical protein [Streptomyces sp. C1-2]|uniref:hypothetical protein n=1 Tax=Streptomyces sp. C1-2 TaxID=2720022 RepID=UPI0019D088D6|nr:hypothetical protein [Streptomyces sp. C1-2]